MVRQLEISVIIPTYNSAVYVKNAIHSVIQQSESRCEIIVVDDGSSDETIRVLKHYQTEVNFQLITQPNSGPGSARNQGMKVAKGRYICFLDADDQLLPTSIAKRFALLEQNPDIALVFNDVVRLDHKDKPGYSFLAHHNFIQKFKPSIEKVERNNYFFNEQYFDCAMKYFPFIWTSRDC